MAKNAGSVTSIQVDNADGPLYYNPDSTIAVTLATDFTTGGWVDFGYGSVDGSSIKQTADSTAKKIWGGNLGTSYSNFKDVITISCASWKSSAAMGIVYGSSNVATDASGVTTVSVRGRQGTKGTFVIKCKSDDGDPMLWVYRGQTSPNISVDLKDSDVATYDLEITGIEDATGVTSRFIFKDSSVPAAAPKP